MIFGSKFGGYVTVEATGKNSAAFLNDLASAVGREKSRRDREKMVNGNRPLCS